MRHPFEDVKQALAEACKFLRSFTLGRVGFTQQDEIAGIQRVIDCCNRMEKLFADGPDAKESKKQSRPKKVISAFSAPVPPPNPKNILKAALPKRSMN